MKRTLLFVAFITAIIAVQSADALPRFALSTGRTCASCHFNGSGGQLRSAGGTRFASDELSIASLRNEESENEYSGAVSKYFTLGGDLRTQFLAVSDTLRSGRTFQMMQMALYTAVTVHERVKIYAKADLANFNYSASTPEFEAFASVALVPKTLNLRVGAFLPSFGVRMDDHTIYTRGGNASVFGLPHVGLIFPFNYKDVGMELAYNYESLVNVQASLLNGGRTFPRFDSTFALALRAEMTPSIGDVHLSVGGSLYTHKPPFGESFGETRQMMGGFFGIGYDRVTVIGEFDVAKNLPGTPKGIQAQAFFTELSVRVIDGLDVVGRYEMFDPNTDSKSDYDESTRIAVGVEFFPWSFIEVRPQYRMNTTKTMVGTVKNELKQNQFLTQIHVFF